MLGTRDFTFAFILHASAVLVLLVANQWRSEHVKVPERVVQVKMVSLAELQSMIPKSKPVSKAKPLVNKPKVLPKLKPKPLVKPKPTLKAKAKPKAQPKKKVVVEEELDYDPFAPMESAPKKRKKKKTNTATALNTMLEAQLTDTEINHYIAGMQQAVEQQWKVPTEMLGKLNDPLVELKLLPTGQVSSVRILESSGSKQLDATLLQAIYAAAPFDIPSQQYALFKTNTIRFHPLR